MIFLSTIIIIIIDNNKCIYCCSLRLRLRHAVQTNLLSSSVINIIFFNLSFFMSYLIKKTFVVLYIYAINKIAPNRKSKKSK